MNKPLLEELVTDDMIEEGLNPEYPEHVDYYWMTKLPQDENADLHIPQ